MRRLYFFLFGIPFTVFCFSQDSNLTLNRCYHGTLGSSSNLALFTLITAVIDSPLILFLISQFCLVSLIFWKIIGMLTPMEMYSMLRSYLDQVRMMQLIKESLYKIYINSHVSFLLHFLSWFLWKKLINLKISCTTELTRLNPYCNKDHIYWPFLN